MPLEAINHVSKPKTLDFAFSKRLFSLVTGQQLLGVFLYSLDFINKIESCASFNLSVQKLVCYYFKYQSCK